MFEVRRGLFVAATALFALTACGDDGNGGMTGPGGDGDGDGGGMEPSGATISGSVEETQETASPATDLSFATASSGSSVQAAEASTVAVAAVNSDGSLEVLAEADVQSDGSFSVEGVPAGRSGLVVSARDSDGNEVGRVLVHGETEGGATITTSPVNGETTVEGLVYARLTEAGVDAQVRNTARLALMIRMDQATAADVAASAQSIQDVADSYRAGAEAQAEVFAQQGADQQAQVDALVQAAADHAVSRDGGESPDAAQEAFVEAAVDAFAQGGVDAEDVSVATAASATGLDQAAAVANENARLELARNAVELNLAARQEFTAGMEDSDEQSQASSALAQAEADVEASASVAEIAQALADAGASAEAELTSTILSRLPDQVPLDVRATLETRLETAFAEADLSADVRGSSDVSAIVQAVMDYRSRVRSAVDAFVSELPSGASVSAEVTTDVLVATQGGPAIGDSEVEGQAGTATLSGSVETTTQVASSVTGFSGATTSTRTSGVAQDASWVAAAAIDDDGALDIVAVAEVQSDGSFTIEDVPAGQTGLVVMAEASGGEEVGRALVQGETESGATITTEPMNGETTVEGHVLQTLTEAGVAEQIRNTARLALMISMDESTAAEVAASAQSIQEVADAYRAGAEAQTEVFAQQGADQQAQAEALMDAARQHAEDRDGGTDPEAAQDGFVQAALDAFEQGGVDSEQVSMATAAAATGLDQAETVANENARLDLARNAVEMNLSAREEFAADLPDSEQSSRAETALADAQTRVEDATSLPEVAQAIEDTENTAEQDLSSMILDKLPEQVPDQARSTIESRLQDAFAQADLSSDLEGSTEVSSIVQTVMDYRDQVRSAVDDFVAELPSGVSQDAEFTTDLLAATQGGPAVGSSSSSTY